MAVNSGGIDTSFSDNAQIVDSVGQYVSGLSFGTGISVKVTLSTGYRFPIEVPKITNIVYDVEKLREII